MRKVSVTVKTEERTKEFIIIVMNARSAWKYSQEFANGKNSDDLAHSLYRDLCDKIHKCVLNGKTSWYIGKPIQNEKTWAVVRAIKMMTESGYIVTRGDDGSYTVSWDFSEEEQFKLDGPEYQAAIKEMVSATT